MASYTFRCVNMSDFVTFTGRVDFPFSSKENGVWSASSHEQKVDGDAAPSNWLRRFKDGDIDDDGRPRANRRTIFEEAVVVFCFVIISCCVRIASKDEHFYILTLLQLYNKRLEKVAASDGWHICNNLFTIKFHFQGNTISEYYIRSQQIKLYKLYQLYQLTVPLRIVCDIFSICFFFRIYSNSTLQPYNIFELSWTAEKSTTAKRCIVWRSV